MQVTIEIPPEAHPMKVSDWLIRHGHAVPAPCGGRGVCGKCLVRVLEGDFGCEQDSEGRILACQAECPVGGGVVEVEEDVGSGLTQFSGGRQGKRMGAEEGVGVALDIGTTTLAAALVRLGDGVILATASALNPQHAWGADVINRIGACEAGHLGAQQRAVLEVVRGLLVELGGENVVRMMVAGNPTMLHLFAGISPEGIGRYPFTPAFLERKEFCGEALGLPVEEVVLLPSASAFIGSDVLGGVLTCGMQVLEGASVLMDIGTNGEMVLCTGRKRGGKMVAVSAAAGPALEGANISCGVGGVRGAVSRVEGCAGEGFRFRTIGDAVPMGLCGCGLVDFMAALLRVGQVDETGCLEEEPAVLRGVQERERGGDVEHAETAVALTQQDVREFQLAKSAMRAGLEALVAHEGLRMEEVEHLFLAGGLGYYLDADSAVRTGLLPGELLSVVKSVGNSSLAGAVRCLVEPGAMAQMEAIATVCESFELNESDVFNEQFVEQMLFPEE